MGKLAEALKAKFKTPKDAMVALGLDPELIAVKRLAADSKRGRDGALFDDQDPEMRAARELSGEAFEKEQRRMDRQLENNMADDDEEEPESGGISPERRRHVRKMCMNFKARDCLERGMSHDEIRDELESTWPMPKNALEGGGELAGDDERAAEIAEDIDFTMKALEQMGGSATSQYEEADMQQEDKHMAKDRRRQLALDRKRELEYLGLDRLTPKGNDFCNYGDRPEPRLAMDEATSDAAAEVDSWFGTGRIGVG